MRSVVPSNIASVHSETRRKSPLWRRCNSMRGSVSQTLLSSSIAAADTGRVIRTCGFITGLLFVNDLVQTQTSSRRKITRDCYRNQFGGSPMPPAVIDL